MDTGGDDGNEEQAKITVRLSLNSQVLKLSITIYQQQFQANIDSKEYQPSKLDPDTQDLISLCFDQDMFNGQLKKYEIGIYKIKE